MAETNKMIDFYWPLNRWPSTKGSLGLWRKHTSCRYCATARSPWLSSVQVTNYISMRAPTWTRFFSSTLSTTNPTSPSPTRISSRWADFSLIIFKLLSAFSSSRGHVNRRWIGRKRNGYHLENFHWRIE